MLGNAINNLRVRGNTEYIIGHKLVPAYCIL
jgi:hypothetical protein